MHITKRLHDAYNVSFLSKSVYTASFKQVLVLPVHTKMQNLQNTVAQFLGKKRSWNILQNLRADKHAAHRKATLLAEADVFLTTLYLTNIASLPIIE